MSHAESTVLIVDDEPHMRRFLKATLAHEGYRTIEATSGARAMEETRSGGVNLVLLDLGLPDVDGAEVTSWIRAESPIPIIVISARALESDKIEALDRGANDYLTKPFGAGELLARIRVALRSERRPGREPLATVFRVGELAVDLERHQVTI